MKCKTEITKQVANLLKHDWERAKGEAAIIKTKPIFIAITLVFIKTVLYYYRVMITHTSNHLKDFQRIHTIINIVIIYIVGFYIIKNILRILEKDERYKSHFNFLNIPYREKCIDEKKEELKWITLKNRICRKNNPQ